MSKSKSKFSIDGNLLQAILYIAVGLLFCISQALGHDFFAELSVMLARSGGH